MSVDKGQLARWLARHRDAALVRALGRSAASIVAALENDSADIESNGEARVLESLAHCDVRHVLDVGAHDGKWALSARRALPAAMIHSFEIDPTVRGRLEQRTAGSGVHVIGYGLSDEAGEVTLYVDDDNPETTSLVAFDAQRRQITCHVETGDAYLDERGIDRVDFLKVDTEGSDLRVLQGFGRALAEGRIGLIQFEFTLWAAVARTWLGDFYDLLSARRYEIGKVYPTSTDWRPYSPRDEIFVRANFLAVHTSRMDLKQAVS